MGTIVSRVATARVERAAEAMSELHQGHLRLQATDDEFAFSQTATDIQGVTFGVLTLGGRTRCATDGFDTVIIARASRGTHRWEVGSEQGKGPRPFLITPDSRLRTESRNLTLQALSMDPATLKRLTWSVTGRRSPLRYPSQVNMDAKDTAVLDAAIHHLATVHQTPQLLLGPLLQTTLLHHLAAAIVSTFGLLPAHESHALEGVESRAVVKAMAFMDEHAGDPVALVDIALASGVSVRTLQNAFRRHREQTPTAYLRATRLHHAHRELVEASPDSTTVEAIAARWGFTNRGRFAQAHLDAFGVTARSTLAGDRKRTSRAI